MNSFSNADGLALHDLAPLATPGGGLERRGLGVKDGGCTDDRCRGGGAAGGLHQSAPSQMLSGGHGR
ncbi:MAG: hypothetical protein ACREUF_18665, partial [Solimonas sp.]